MHSFSLSIILFLAAGLTVGTSSATVAEPPPSSVDGVPLPAGVSASWWTQVQDDIRRSEYHVTWQEQTRLPDLPGGFQAPNRAHNLRTYFMNDGIRVIPRTSQEPEWTWGMSLQGYGTKGNVQAVAQAELVPLKNRMEYQRGEGLTEWYVNDKRGLEQGFTLKQPPGSQGEETESWIILRLALHGNLKGTLNTKKDKIEFVTPEGFVAMQYG